MRYSTGSVLSVSLNLGLALGRSLPSSGDDSDSGSGITIGAGVNIGVGTDGGSYSSSGAPTSIWKPTANTTWSIKLSQAYFPSELTNPDVEAYDMDLYTNTKQGNDSSVIDELHAKGKKVICYFSAGTFEDKRPDSAKFPGNAKGKTMKEWHQEQWLDIRLQSVRDIMQERIETAAKMHCDAVDPDNVDGFDPDNETGFDFTKQDSIDFVKFLADTAHSHNMAIGLKNADGILNDVLDYMQFSVQEECIKYNNCNAFQPFTAADKPVFHIEYPEKTATANPVDSSKWCGGDAKGFSTVIKEMKLNGWVQLCDDRLFNFDDSGVIDGTNRQPGDGDPDSGDGGPNGGKGGDDGGNNNGDDDDSGSYRLSARTQLLYVPLLFSVYLLF